MFDTLELEVIRRLRDSAQAGERPFADAYQFVSRRLRGKAIGAAEYDGIIGAVAPVGLAARVARLRASEAPHARRRG